jgi:hypothetical protein
MEEPSYGDGNVRFSGSVEEVKQNPKIVDEACF